MPQPETETAPRIEEIYPYDMVIFELLAKDMAAPYAHNILMHRYRIQVNPGMSLEEVKKEYFDFINKEKAVFGPFGSDDYGMIKNCLDYLKRHLEAGNHLRAVKRARNGSLENNGIMGWNGPSAAAAPPPGGPTTPAQPGNATGQNRTLPIGPNNPYCSPSAVPEEERIRIGDFDMDKIFADSFGNVYVAEPLSWGEGVFGTANWNGRRYMSTCGFPVSRDQIAENFSGDLMYAIRVTASDYSDIDDEDIHDTYDYETDGSEDQEPDGFFAELEDTEDDLSEGYNLILEEL